MTGKFPIHTGMQHKVPKKKLKINNRNGDIFYIEKRCKYAMKVLITFASPEILAFRSIFIPNLLI